MIIFKHLKWSNFFSYGDSNYIDFTDNTVTQLVGINGAGKTSIALILQEVLFGKNVKKIIKSKLKNRNTKGNGSAELSFDVGDNSYLIIMSRSATKLTMNLYENGEDISSHTAPATLKSIENILNLDFEVASQLTYQSSKSGLQFLTATDTQRKKFLITLFNLEKYTEIFEQIKVSLKTLNSKVSEIQGKYEVYENWINQHKNTDLSIQILKEVPSMNQELMNELAKLELKRKESASINKTINTNRQYKQQITSIDSSLLTKQKHNPQGIKELTDSLSKIRFQKSEKEKTLKSVEGVEPFCRLCKQPIDISDSKKLAEECSGEIKDLNKKFSNISAQLKILKEQQAEDLEVDQAIQEFEKLSNLIDYNLSEDIVNVKDVEVQIQELKNDISKLQKDIQSVAFYNQKAAEHNSKVKVIEGQLSEYREKLLQELNQLEKLYEEVGNLEVLKEAFSTNGLIGYKLEYLVKDLELVINTYLQELSRGRFQLTFILKDDKLNIEISDNGSIITINEVSEGELSKINVSTLLAIRKLMQQLSNTKLNVLFLDEIMGVLDPFGKEDLINILLKEESLNTFLVSHEYAHPLVPSLHIVQEDGISKIDRS